MLLGAGVLSSVLEREWDGIAGRGTRRPSFVPALAACAFPPSVFDKIHDGPGFLNGKGSPLLELLRRLRILEEIVLFAFPLHAFHVVAA